MDRVEVIVVGAGVIGLAIAREFAAAGREVVVLEREARIGTGASSRNSEVIHAGLYYPGDYLKTRLCVSGRRLLYEYCRTHGVEHRRTGKLLLATGPAEAPRLRALMERAVTNGVRVSWLEPEAVRDLEPEIRCSAAVWSPDSGIVDSHGLMTALQGELESAGGMVVCNASVGSVVPAGGGFTVSVGEDQDELGCSVLVNAAGLGAQSLASAIAGLPTDLIPPLRMSKGHYYSLSGRNPFRHLVYPLPSGTGLGVHVTLDLQGRARFGPDSRPVSREDYEFEEDRLGPFAEAIGRYYPAIREENLNPAYTGIRSQVAMRGKGSGLGPDFQVQGPREHGVPGLVNLFGIESPGLTAALALARHVAGLPGIAPSGRR